MIRLSQAEADTLAGKKARGDSASHRKECVRVLALLITVPNRPGRRGRRVSDHTIRARHCTLAAFFRYRYERGSAATPRKPLACRSDYQPPPDGRRRKVG